MRKLQILFVLMLLTVIYISCNKKDNNSDRFNYLTDNVWMSDSLLVNGIDASGAGGILEKFVGEADFNKDGSGTFGQYPGGWYFTDNETKITITSSELLIPLTCNIIELNATSFKISTSYTDPVAGFLSIRITFKAN